MNHRTILIASIAFALFPVVATAQTITAGTTGSAFSATTAGGSYILNLGDTRTFTGTSEAVTFGGATGPFTLTVNGSLISNAAASRGVRGANSNVTFNVTVGGSGLIQAFGDDAIQARNGTFNVTNNGTIYSGSDILSSPITAIGTGQALDLTSAVGGTVINNVTGLIRADGHDAVRLGSNMTMTNYGTVRTNGVVNDNSANNVFNTAPNNSVATTFSANDGVSFEGGANSSLNNYGLITGSRHGTETDTGATNIVLTNQAAGIIIGRNGSGFGSDATSAVVSNITVHNYGIIRGDFAGVGNIIDRTGAASFTQDGDGDGVDIDGAGTVNNYGGGQIKGTGANGFDSGGRANTADGIAIGGGLINNSGLIQGAGVGIVVNNDTSISRSGVAATTITNNFGGTIEGLNGYAIRLENKHGDARDNDTITNAGTIVGNGSIPNPSGTVTLQNGATDTNSSGTLNGVTYTGTGVARFIRGDGSAIQTGEGNDVINNSGTITGNTGRAIAMEGGNDILNIQGGAASITGSIDGGTGTNTLNITLGAGNTFSYSGTITNFNTSVQSGTFNYTGASTLGGNVTVDGGTFKSNGGTVTGTVTVNSGTVSGTNLSGVALSIGAGATLSPGNSPGTLSTGSETWAGGGSYLWEINRLLADGGAQGADPGWDFADITGSLTITANSGNKFNINLDSLALLSSWDNSQSYSFNLATASGGIFGFDASDFLINTSAFDDLHSLGVGHFYVEQDGNSLELNFTPVPEPATIGIGIALMGVAFIRRRRGA
jgi:fibronectin-binding autotransporter adhesin